MTIAELFVNIGVKGDGQAKEALKNTKSGLQDIKSNAILAKAALIGVIYGMQQLLMDTSRTGMALQQFKGATGLSVQELQKWQVAGRQFGVGADEVAGSIKGIQSAMTNMLLGKGAPEGMGIVARMVGFDPSKARDTFYVLEKLQAFAKIAPPDVGGHVLRNFGLSDNMLQFLRQNNLDISKIQAPYSDKSIARAAKMSAALDNLGMRFRLFLGGFALQHGDHLISILGRTLTVIQDVTKAVSTLMKDFPAMRDVAVAAGVAIAAAWAPVTAAVAGLVLLLNEVQKYREGKDSLFNGKSGVYDSPFAQAPSKLMNWLTSSEAMWGANDTTKRPAGAKSIFDEDKKPAGNSTVNQTFNFQHDGKNARDVGDSAKRGIREAYRQLPSQPQVN